MKRNIALFSLCLLVMGSLAALSLFETRALKKHAPEMREASERLALAFDAIKKERLARGLAIDPADDPNETGLIGAPYTEITTTLGGLDVKRSTTNPNVAAMIVDMFISLGLSPGDRIAVNFSGSFPALNLSVLAAMDTLGIDGVSIFSVGASTYGANLPEFTYGDMEHLLVQKGLLEHHSSFFSLGGQSDLGLEMPEALREAIAGRLQSLGYQLLSYTDFSENMSARLAHYQQIGPVRCFVNVGGNLLSFGQAEFQHTTQSGILTPPRSPVQGDGLIDHFLSEGIPVIQLLNMKALLPAHGLPIDPIPLPQPGEGDVYWKTVAPWPLGVALVIINLCGLIWVGCIVKKKEP